MLSNFNRERIVGESCRWRPTWPFTWFTRGEGRSARQK